jgi:hypothetical protein
MARPKVFLSSTFYDLKQIRSDLEDFITELGYEPVLHERGGVPYGTGDALEDYCYQEIHKVDIVVNIVGGRFGSTSKHGQDSISQRELKEAHKNGKQIYIFIDRNVQAEFRTYKVNKDVKGMKYAAVDNERIYQFLEFLESLPQNNTMQGFDTAADIVRFLREQWAGLFQRYLHEAIRQKERREIEDLQATARSLKEISQVLVAETQALLREKKGHDDVLKGAEKLRDVMLSNHPAMARIRALLNPGYRVYFTTRNELNDWLGVRGFKGETSDYGSETESWLHTPGKNAAQNAKPMRFTILSSIFDEEGRLRVMPEGEWDDDFISYVAVEPPKPPDDYAGDYGGGGTDNDIPF